MNKLIIYKENSDQFMTFVFEEIEFMTFRNLYYNKIAQKDTKKDKDNARGLKVMDLLIR